MSVVPASPRRLAATLEHVPRTLHVLLAVLFFVAACCAASVTMFSYVHAHRGIARTIARYVPYPAYVVGGRVVWYGEVSERANALAAIAALTPDEAVQRASELAVRHKVLLQLADELNVTLPREEVAAFTQRDAVLTVLRSAADWRKADYHEFGVQSYLFAQAVERAALASRDLQSAAFGRAARLQTKLQEGIPFFEIAQQYSDGAAAVQGGDLGYVLHDEVPEAWRSFVVTAEVGDISEVLETDLGLWIVRLEDRIDTEDGEMVSLRVIEVKKDLLHDVLEDKMEDVRVIQLLQ